MRTRVRRSRCLKSRKDSIRRRFSERNHATPLFFTVTWRYLHQHQWERFHQSTRPSQTRPSCEGRSRAHPPRSGLLLASATARRLLLVHPTTEEETRTHEPYQNSAPRCVGAGRRRRRARHGAAVPDGDAGVRRRPLHRRLQGAEPVVHRLHRRRHGHQQRCREVDLGREVVVRRQPAGHQRLERHRSPSPARPSPPPTSMRTTARWPPAVRVSFGFNGSYSGTNAVPDDLHAQRRDLQRRTTGDRRRRPTTTPPTTTPTTRRPRPTGTKVDNPYAGAKGYVNPEWGPRPTAEPGGSRISNTADRRLARPDRGDRRHRRTAAPTARWACATTWTPRSRQGAALHPVRHLQPARPRLLGARLQRRARPDRARPVQDRVHRPDRGDPGRPEVRAACGSSTIIEIDSLPNLVTNTGSRRPPRRAPR